MAVCNLRGGLYGVSSPRPKRFPKPRKVFFSRTLDLGNISYPPYQAHDSPIGTLYFLSNPKVPQSGFPTITEPFTGAKEEQEELEEDEEAKETQDGQIPYT